MIPFKTIPVALIALLCHSFAPAEIQFRPVSYYEAGVAAHEAGKLQMAISFFEQGVEKGDAKSMFALGSYYHFGEGVPKDLVKSRTLFEKSAASGSPDATTMLGIIYREGQGVSTNKQRAFEYFKAAAQACSDIGQEKLAQMLFEAEGVPEDKVQALAWLYLASKSNTNSDAAAGVTFVEKALTANQVQAAKIRQVELERSLKCPG